MSTTIQTYYDSNMARGEYITGRETWSSAGNTSIIILPDTDKALFVENVSFQVSDNFAMPSGAEFTITINAYGNTASPQVITVSAVDAIKNIMAIGDSALASTFTLSSVEYLTSVLKFKPPVYLESSPTVVENITITYTGGAITAGECIISYDAWSILEANSGV